MPTAQKERNGKATLTDYVVTVQVEHYVTLRAATEQRASERAVNELSKRYGLGSPLNDRATVIEVEKCDG